MLRLSQFSFRFFLSVKVQTWLICYDEMLSFQLVNFWSPLIVFCHLFRACVSKLLFEIPCPLPGVEITTFAYSSFLDVLLIWCPPPGYLLFLMWAVLSPDPQRFKTKPILYKVIFLFLDLSYRRSGKETGCRYWLLNLAFEKVMKTLLTCFSVSLGTWQVLHITDRIRLLC